MEKIAVIIPTYNASGYISETITTIMEQTHKPWVIIIVDDGSTDSTIKEAEKVLSGSSDKINFEIISKSNSGASSARNVGINLISSKYSDIDYFCFSDADDPWSLIKLEEQLNLFRSGPDTLVLCITALRIINSSGCDLGFIPNHLKDNERFDEKYAKATITSITPTSMIKNIKGILDVNFDENLTYWEDLKYFTQLSKFGDVGCCESGLVKRRVHDASISQNIQLVNYMSSSIDVWEFLLQNVDKKIADDFIATRKRAFIIHCIKQRQFLKLKLLNICRTDIFKYPYLLPFLVFNIL
ncbi:glycosyltransferase family 2 protein [Proteus terrae]|uniref:glycosyltransferase family 2 protein n=1 Tax=Proteus terrae TaxID=1574161 RepID=UPI0034E4122E